VEPVHKMRLFNLLSDAALAVLAAVMFVPGMAAQSPVSLKPATLPRVATIPERFQSFNIEMVEVTGGRFWAPYKKQGAGAAPAETGANKSAPAGIDPSAYRYRAPINLANPRLRKLAAGLAPSYVRVSGTWENTTYFHDSDTPAPTAPPAGFSSVLTRPEWKGVVDFSNAVDAKLVTSFAISPGVRDAQGVWTPVEAKKIFAYTKQAGGSIAAAEMFNEPTFATMGGAPKGYDGAAYKKDFEVFHAFVKEADPEMIVLGPGSVGELGLAVGLPAKSMIRTEDMMDAAGPEVDAFSYHFYGAVSQRCKVMAGAPQTTPEAALTNQWLSLTGRDEAFYAGLRDRFAPGKPLWLTETGETACGGNPWSADFIDSFRYLNQLGLLAKRGVQVVMHNTLDASDYALVDEATLIPRPNYWAALLWRKNMGTTVLDAGASPSPNLHLYAHCLRNEPGGVALLAINADRSAEQELMLPVKSQRYTLTAKELMDNKVELNGHRLEVSKDGDLPELSAVAQAAGRVRFAPASITFLAISDAGNASCR
jgi:heparanase 1